MKPFPFWEMVVGGTNNNSSQVDYGQSYYAPQVKVKYYINNVGTINLGSLDDLVG